MHSWQIKLQRKHNHIMRKLIIICLALGLSTACKQTAKDKETETTANAETAGRADSTTNRAPASEGKSFDINSVPISNKDIGTFPFFGAPEGMSYQVENDKQFHRTYFGINGKLVPIEGRTYAAAVRSESNSSKDFEPLLFEKNYDNLITSVGGVLVSNTKVESAEIERVGRDELFKYHGVADIYNDPVKTYLIRRADAEIWVQLSFNTAAGSITVVQKGDMKQSASIIQAPEIKKDLDQDGKAVLYIQFDTDKATLKPEGDKAVNEIGKMLSTYKDLNISINGYTDSSGTQTRNLQLSRARAATVLNAVVAIGVDKGRLISEGFGDANPIADNSTEEGKAKNRRVELIKK